VVTAKRTRSFRRRRCTAWLLRSSKSTHWMSTHSGSASCLPATRAAVSGEKTILQDVPGLAQARARAPDAAAHVRLDPQVEESQRRHDHVKDVGADAPQLAAQGDLA
jgi:hypothetical protein